MIGGSADSANAAAEGNRGDTSDDDLFSVNTGGDAQPFAYIEEALGGDVEELATSTNNPKFAVKMLGYDQNTFGDILHNFKPDNGVGPADNVIWHDNGDVYFNGGFVANFHDAAN